MNKIRKTLNDIVRETGNKIVPKVMKGPISRKEYGLGDILTYEIGYRHVGAVVGASIPIAISTKYELGIPLPMSIATNLGFSAICGGIGYIVGFGSDLFSVMYKKPIKQNGK